MTFRSVFIGTLLMVFLSFTIPYNDYKIQSTFITGNFLPIGVVLILAVFALVVNVLWRARLMGGEEFLVALWGIGIALFGLVSDRRGLLEVLPLAMALSVALVAVRAWGERRKEPARQTRALGWLGAGILLFLAFNYVFPFFALLGVVWDIVRLAQIPEVRPNIFDVTASRALTAALLAADAAAVLYCASRASRLRASRPEQPRFDQVKALLVGTFVSFGLYAVGKLASGALNPLARLVVEDGRVKEVAYDAQVFPGVWAFLALLVLIGAGTLLRRLGASGLVGRLKIALSSTRGRATAALAAGGLAFWLVGSLFWALLAAAAAAFAVEATIRFRDSEWRPGKKGFPFVLAAGALALAILVPLMIFTHRWEWLAAAFGLLVLGLLGLADPKISGAIDWLAVLGMVSGAVALLATGSATAAILVGSAAAFGAFCVAGACALVRSPGRCLSRSELIVIFILMLAGCGVPSSGLVRYLYPSMVAPAYYAGPENKWGERLMPYIPDFLTPSKSLEDPEDPVTPFFEGYRPDELRERGVSAWEAIPWHRWVGPTVSWLVIVGLCYFMMLCLSVLLRRQWEEHERLSFPLVQVPLEMTEEPAQGRLLSGFFRNKAVWLGAAIPIIVHGINGLSRLNSKVPRFDMEISFWDLLQAKPHWSAMEPFHLSMFFTVIGIMYLLPMEVSLSLWFFWILLQAQLFFGSFANLTLVEVPLKQYLPRYQHIGCYIAYTLFLVWTARHHIADVFRKIRGPWRCPPWGMLALVGGSPLLFLLSRNTGTPLPEAAALTLVYLLTVPVGMVLSRISEGAPEGSWRRSVGHLTGLATLTALFFSYHFGWSAFVPLLAVLVEARRRARASPEVSVGTMWAAWVPTAIMFVALFVPAAVGGAYQFLMVALAAYTLALPLPWLLRARWGLRGPAFACQGVAAVLIPVVLGQHVWGAGWAVTAGVCFVLLGPIAGLMRDLSPEAADVDDSREGMSYRTAFLGLIGAALGIAQLAAVATGMSFGVALAAVVVFLMILVIFSRVVAQGGLPFIQHWFVPAQVMYAAGGPKLMGLDPATDWGAKSQVMLGWTDDFFVHDMRECAMPSMMNSFKMGEQATRDKRKLLWIIVLSIGTAVVVSSVVRIYLSYAHGGLTLEKYSHLDAPKQFFERAVTAIQHPEEFKPGYMIGIGSGLALTAFVLAMASRFYWWPLHPIGLLVYPSWALRHFWWSIFLGWLLKTAIWKFGGARGFKKMRPFFLGLILGDCLIGGVWIVAGLVIGQKILSIMPG